MRLLNQLTLSKGLLLIAFTAAVGIGWYNYAVQDAAMQSSIRELEDMRNIADNMVRLQDEHSQALLSLVLTKKAADAIRRQELHLQVDLLDQNLESLSVNSAEGRLLLKKYRASRAAMEEAEDKLFIAISSSANTSETLSEFKAWKDASRESASRMSDLESYLAARLAVVMQENSEMTQHGLIALAVIFALGLLAIVASHLHFYRNLVVPIEKLEKALKDLAEGNLSTRVRITSKDELGRLGQNFNKMAQQLQTMTESLENSNDSLKNFTAIVAHDLRSPLASMLGYLELMQDKDLDDASREETAGVIENIAQRTIKLLDTLLSYATAQSKHLEIRHLNARSEMEHVLVDLAGDIQKYDGEVELLEMPDIDADPVQFQELFRNLVSNGLKYRRPDVRPKVSVRGYSAQHDGRDVYCFEVKDNGIGFDTSLQKELFQPFHRLERSARVLGSGMGLSICKTIVDRHKGWIRAESHIGKGSIFTVEIPRELNEMLTTEAK